MLGALGRWVKSISYLLTGRMDAARKALDTNPHVVRAKYDEVIKEKDVAYASIQIGCSWIDCAARKENGQGRNLDRRCQTT